MSNHRRKRLLFHLAWWAAALPFVLFACLPVLWMVSTSLQPTAAVFQLPPHWLPERVAWSNYPALFAGSHFLRSLVNSALVALATSAISVLVASMAGYALARLPFRGRSGVLFAILSAQMVPGVLFLLPIFVLMKQLGLLNTLWALLFANVSFALPFSIWMMQGFYKRIPLAVEEAACVDGAGAALTFFRIVLPMALPGVVSCAIFSFLTAWDEFVFAIALTINDDLRTLPALLYDFMGQFGIEWNELMGAAVLVTAPALVFFVLLQKYILQGFASGAIKG